MQPAAIMRQSELQTLSHENAQVVARFFQVLADPTRVRLVKALADGKWCVSDLVQALEMDQPAISHQLKYLRKLRLVTTAERYRTERTDEVLFDSTYTLDISREPKWIDIVGTEAEMKGKLALGIYELRGDRLTICYTLPGRERPKSFESKAGSGSHLAVWKRAPLK